MNFRLCGFALSIITVGCGSQNSESGVSARSRGSESLVLSEDAAPIPMKRSATNLLIPVASGTLLPTHVFCELGQKKQIQCFTNLVQAVSQAPAVGLSIVSCERTQCDPKAALPLTWTNLAQKLSAPELTALIGEARAKGKTIEERISILQGFASGPIPQFVTAALSSNDKIAWAKSSSSYDDYRSTSRDSYGGEGGGPSTRPSSGSSSADSQYCGEGGCVSEPRTTQRSQPENYRGE